MQVTTNEDTNAAVHDIISLKYVLPLPLLNRIAKIVCSVYGMNDNRSRPPISVCNSAAVSCSSVVYAPSFGRAASHLAKQIETLVKDLKDSEHETNYEEITSLAIKFNPCDLESADVLFHHK
jgi:hypothetical protein